MKNQQRKSLSKSINRFKRPSTANYDNIVVTEDNVTAAMSPIQTQSKFNHRLSFNSGADDSSKYNRK